MVHPKQILVAEHGVPLHICKDPLHPCKPGQSWLWTESKAAKPCAKVHDLIYKHGKGSCAGSFFFLKGVLMPKSRKNVGLSSLEISEREWLDKFGHSGDYSAGSSGKTGRRRRSKLDEVDLDSQGNPPPYADTGSNSGEKYLWGAIPLEWLIRAAALKGRTLEVAIVIWWMAGMDNCDTVLVPDKQLEQMGVDSSAKSRALTALENAGLLKKMSSPGQLARVRILPVGDR